MSLTRSKQHGNRRNSPPDAARFPVREATIEDLYGINEKAEIVSGRIVRFMATGGMPGFAGDEITFALQMYVRRVRRGVAVGDNKGFAVDLPNRKSFSPDAAFYVGTNPGMKFYQGAPFLPWKCEARMITASRPSATWHKNAPTILMQEPKSFGMWICFALMPS